jgi:hypothetical protein
LDELKNDTAKVDFIINFAYPEQQGYIKVWKKTEFDCEAMIATNEQIHIFTKDWKYNRSSHYTLNISEGFQDANFQNYLNADGLITDATLVDETLYLIGYKNYIGLFWKYDINNSQNFLSRIELENTNRFQIEGITYINDTLFVTSEKSAIEPSLFYLIP